MNQIIIDGIPVPWSAHRGYGRRSFNPKFKEREFYQWQIRAQWNQKEPISGPISLKIVYHFPIPVATSKTKRLQMLNQRIYHIKRPDLDNANKFLCDALKTIVMEDDSQIVHIDARKIYSERPRTIVEVDCFS